MVLGLPRCLEEPGGLQSMRSQSRTCLRDRGWCWVFLAAKRSLVGYYCLWCLKESDRPERQRMVLGLPRCPVAFLPFS